ncbi:MAG: arginine repressor [Calditrichaeota bacterium]|nr:MAG: arginine repressor [Calditrichota bacterium]
MNKQTRHRHIRELILGQKISSQEELSNELKNIDIDVTQATLSRDLHELRIVRMPLDNGFRYVLPQTASGKQLKKVVQHEIIQILHNENCIIIKTLLGRAAGVAIFLDTLKHPYILGTIAGDDTVMVIPSSVQHTSDLADYLFSFDSENTNDEA